MDRWPIPASNTSRRTLGFMKKQIDLFGNEISIEKATEKPVAKVEEKKEEITRQELINRPFSVLRVDKETTWIFHDT
jgi:hypothetical protein